MIGEAFGFQVVDIIVEGGLVDLVVGNDRAVLYHLLQFHRGDRTGGCVASIFGKACPVRARRLRLRPSAVISEGGKKQLPFGGIIRCSSAELRVGKECVSTCRSRW